MLLQPPSQEKESIFTSCVQAMEDIYSSCSTRQERPILKTGASHSSTHHLDSSKPNRKKRLHTKSRHGCINCKARKVKVSLSIPPSELYNDTSYSVKKHDPIHAPTASTGTWSVNIRRASRLNVSPKDGMEIRLVRLYLKNLRHADQARFLRS